LRADALSRAFAAALQRDGESPGEPSPPGSLIGIEHEYRVLRDGVQVDFRTLISQLQLGRLYLDPADARAYRLRSGAAVTCDGAEAEIALEPIATSGDYSHTAAQRVDEERSALEARLGSDYQLVGYSTHISLSIDADLGLVDDIAWLYSRTFAAALLLIIGDHNAYGIGIRPRPGRLELCCEYMVGNALQAALNVAVGSVRACAAHISTPGRTPPELIVALEPASERYGYRVHRGMFDGDLYDRDVRLPSASGVLSAEEYLRAVTAAVAAQHRGSDAAPDAATATLRNAFGRMAEVLQRPAFEMAAVMLTWDAAVLVARQRTGKRLAFACVPRAAMQAFFELLDAGALDGIIVAYLRQRRDRSQLNSRAQMSQGGLYGSLGRRRALLPQEIHPRFAAVPGTS
jgi:hypothetical protein